MSWGKHLGSADVGVYLHDERHVQRYGSPVPEYYFAKPYRLWHIDWAYPRLGVAIEVEGGTWATVGKDGKIKGHGNPITYADNCRKYGMLALLGWIVIRCTTDMLDKGEAWPLIDAALELRKSIGVIAAEPLDVTSQIGELIEKIGKPPKKKPASARSRKPSTAAISLST
jgi:hypothetical protein